MKHKYRIFGFMRRGSHYTAAYYDSDKPNAQPAEQTGAAWAINLSTQPPTVEWSNDWLNLFGYRFWERDLPDFFVDKDGDLMDRQGNLVFEGPR